MTDSHSAHSDEAPPSYDDINTPVIVLVGAISAIVTLITIMFVQGLSYHWQNSHILGDKTARENMPAVIEIEKQKQLLVGSEGLVPIEDAMKKVAAKYGK